MQHFPPLLCNDAILVQVVQAKEDGKPEAKAAGEAAGPVPLRTRGRRGTGSAPEARHRQVRFRYGRRRREDPCVKPVTKPTQPLLPRGPGVTYGGSPLPAPTLLCSQEKPRGCSLLLQA